MYGPEIHQFECMVQKLISLIMYSASPGASAGAREDTRRALGRCRRLNRSLSESMVHHFKPYRRRGGTPHLRSHTTDCTTVHNCTTVRLIVPLNTFTTTCATVQLTETVLCQEPPRARVRTRDVLLDAVDDSARYLNPDPLPSDQHPKP